MCSKDTEEMAKKEESDQNAPLVAIRTRSAMLAQTSVPILRIKVFT